CRYFLTAAAGLWLALPLPGQEPARLPVAAGQVLASSVEPSANQQLANTIAAQLRQSGQLHHYRVEIACQNGRAELTGSVADGMQRDEIVRLVRGVPGVERVREHFRVGEVAVVTVHALEPAPPPAPVTPGPGLVGGEPVPSFQAPMPSPYDLNPPK